MRTRLTKLLLIVMLLSFAVLGYTQTGTYTITAQDSEGTLFKWGSYRIELEPPFGNPTPIKYGGTTDFQKVFEGSIDLNGQFVVTLPATLFIAPAGTLWSVQTCSYANFLCYKQKYTTVTGAQTLLIISDKPLRVFTGEPIKRAYSDAEMYPPVTGGLYYNLITDCVKVQSRGLTWYNLGCLATLTSCPSGQVISGYNPVTGAPVCVVNGSGGLDNVGCAVGKILQGFDSNGTPICIEGPVSETCAVGQVIQGWDSSGNPICVTNTGGGTCPPGFSLQPSQTSSPFTTLYSDTFNRSNASLAGEGSWTNWPSGSAFIGDCGDGSLGSSTIASNQLSVGNLLGNVFTSVINGDSFAQVKQIAHNIYSACVAINVSADGKTYYAARRQWNDNKLQLYRCVGGSCTSEGGASSATVADGDSWGISKSGGNISALKNGSAAVTWADGSPLAAGGAGLSSGDPSLVIDNFSFGTVTASPAMVCAPTAAVPLLAANTCPSNQYASAINTSGTLTCSTPIPQNIQAVSLYPSCTTPSSSDSTCAPVITWPVAWADTSYVVSCMLAQPDSPFSWGAGPLIFTYTKTTTQTVLVLQTQTGQAVTTRIDCVGVHLP